MQIAAPAKINLSLEITGRRPDGYHEIVSVMQTVSLADSLRLEAAEGVRVQVQGADLPADNLVTRAAALLRRRFDVTAGCAIALEKRIPIAAGLGGGSSDAAAALLALAQMWKVQLDTTEAADLAAELGSDVPFFLHGGTALVEGRGERLTSLPAPCSCWYLLVNPGFPILTAAVYGALRREEWTDGEVTRAVAARLDPSRRAPLGVNALQEPLFRVSPETRECFHEVAALAPGGAMVSGSGPTVFAPYSDAEEAEAARVALRSRGYWAEIACGTPAGREQIRCG